MFPAEDTQWLDDGPPEDEERCQCTDGVHGTDCREFEPDALTPLLEASPVGCQVVSRFALPSDDELAEVNAQLDFGRLPVVMREEGGERG